MAMLVVVEVVVRVLYLCRYIGRRRLHLLVYPCLSRCTYTSGHPILILQHRQPSPPLSSLFLLLFSSLFFSSLQVRTASSLFTRDFLSSAPRSSLFGLFPSSSSSCPFVQRECSTSSRRLRQSAAPLVFQLARTKREGDEKGSSREKFPSPSSSLSVRFFPGFLLSFRSPPLSLDFVIQNTAKTIRTSPQQSNRCFGKKKEFRISPLLCSHHQHPHRPCTSSAPLPRQHGPGHRSRSASLSSSFFSLSLLLLSCSLSSTSRLPFSRDMSFLFSRGLARRSRRREEWIVTEDDRSCGPLLSLSDFSHLTDKGDDEDEDPNEPSFPPFSSDTSSRRRRGLVSRLDGGSSRRRRRKEEERGEEFEGVLSNEELREMVRQGYIYPEYGDEEEEEERDAEGHPNAEAPFIIEGHRFNGTSPFASPPYGPMKRMVPYSRDLSYIPDLENLRARSGHQEEEEEEGADRGSCTHGSSDSSAPRSPSSRRPSSSPSCREEIQEFWELLGNHTKHWDFYDSPGSRFERTNEGVLVTPPIFPNRVFYFTRDEVRERSYESPYADGSVKFEEASYLNPLSPALRTGRKRDRHRRTDTGKKQKKRWGMEDEIQNDIPRGNWTVKNDIFKDMLDSIDWEREWPHAHDQNYYKRSDVSTLLGDNDRNEDSYFDPQFMGGVDTYPRAVACGLSFTWSLHWVPWLCKKFPRRGGQPIKSQIFNLGGIEPLQVWFYPDGCEASHPGFCAFKLVSRPGWNLPFKINMWIQGSTVTLPFSSSSSLSSDGEVTRGEGEPAERRREAKRTRRSAGKGEDREASVKEEREKEVSYRTFRSRVETGPVTREDAAYVAYSMSFCRLLDKRSFLRAPNPPFPPFGEFLRRGSTSSCPGLIFNPETDVVLGASGNVEIGVEVFDDPAAGADSRWEWDDGHWAMDQWLKLQSSYPDDLELEHALPASFTNSDMYENYKYRDVPDRHFAKYLPSMLPPPVDGEDFEQLHLCRRHCY